MRRLNRTELPEIPTRLKAEPQPYTLNLGELRRRSNASSCSRQLYRELIGITPLAYLKQRLSGWPRRACRPSRCCGRSRFVTIGH